MPPHAVIFDIDGVIVDSEQLHFDVLLDLVPEQARHHRPQDLIGLSLEETLARLGVPPERQPSILSQVEATYRRRLSARSLRPEVPDVIAALERQGIPLGFVSTAPRALCLANLALLTLKAPPRLISGDDVPRTKPHPAPYRAMLRLLKADPSEVIAIEDTDIGIESAIQAGIDTVYAWPHSLSLSQNYQKAFSVVRKLSHIEALKFLEFSSST